MIGMILAAGFGTRLRPVTFTLPKPMVPLCNRPLIDWAVESYLAGGVREIVVNLHHLPEHIEEHLRARYGEKVDFHFSIEEEILGTGGGVRRVRPWLERAGEFFLVNGDTVQFPRYAELRSARAESEAVAALTLRHPPAGDRFTAVWLENGRVTGFGNGTGEPLMFAGSHLISSRIFDYLPDKDFSGIVDEVYQPLLDARTETIAGIVDDSLWFDIGTPQRYLSATAGLLDAIVRGEVTPPAWSRVAGESLIDQSASIDGEVTRSTVGARTTVHGALRDSSVWDGCSIGADVLLERCIVAHGVELAGPIELHDALVCRDDVAIPPEYPRLHGAVVLSLA